MMDKKEKEKQKEAGSPTRAILPKLIKELQSKVIKKKAIKLGKEANLAEVFETHFPMFLKFIKQNSSLIHLNLAKTNLKKQD